MRARRPRRTKRRSATTPTAAAGLAAGEQQRPTARKRRSTAQDSEEEQRGEDPRAGGPRVVGPAHCRARLTVQQTQIEHGSYPSFFRRSYFSNLFFFTRDRGDGAHDVVALSLGLSGTSSSSRMSVQAAGHSAMPGRQPQETGHIRRMDVRPVGLQRSNPRSACSS